MNAHRTLRTVVILCGALVLLALPILFSDGRLWITAALMTVTVAEGVGSRAVYGCLALLVVTDALYGGDVGVSALAYIVTVLSVIVSMRFISLQAWTEHERWRVGGFLRTVTAAFLLYCIGSVAAVILGDVLYGYGVVRERLLVLATMSHAMHIAVVIALVSVLYHRISVPFRRTVVFGV